VRFYCELVGTFLSDFHFLRINLNRRSMVRTEQSCSMAISSFVYVDFAEMFAASIEESSGVTTS
jgi:hypothetical protein